MRSLFLLCCTAALALFACGEERSLVFPGPASAVSPTPSVTPTASADPTPSVSAPAAPTPSASATATPSPSPLRPEPDLPMRVSPERLLAAPTRHAHALSRGGFVALTPDGIVRQAATGEAVEALGDAPGQPISVAALGRELLVAGPAGVFVYEAGEGGGALRPSPLGDALGDALPATLLSTPGPGGADLWVASSDRLRLFRDGTLLRVQPSGLDVAGARMTLGTPRDGLASLWVAAGADLYALVVDETGLRAWPTRDDLEIESFAVDGGGALWVVAQGDLHRRDREGRWFWLRLPEAARAVVASPGSEALWVATAAGLWHRQGETWRSVAGVEGLIDADSAFFPDNDGALLVAGARGLTRVRPGRFLRLEGLVNGALLEAPTPIRVEPAAPEQVAEVIARWAGEEIALAGPPWSLTLDPETLENGAYELGVTVTYNDGAPPASGRLRFTVRRIGPSTWSTDIAPLFETYCAACHDASGFAHPMDTRALWIDEFDLILAAVREARMPLPPNRPLGEADIERLEAWREAAFP